MKKKVISSFILLVLFFLGMSSCFAAELPNNTILTTSGYFEYKIQNDNTAVITKFYERGTRDVIIPDQINGHRVEIIESEAFKDSTSSMVTVTIPNTVDFICEDAFDGCDNLEKVYLGTNDSNAPHRQKNMHLFVEAFKNCGKLNEIYVYESISEYKDLYNVFVGCDNLKTIYGHKGSNAEKVANSKGLTFIQIIPFNDVSESDWFYKAAKYTYENKIITGYNSTTFAPNDKITRGMMVTILYKMEGCPEVSGNSKFTDVKSTEYYAKAVKWAADNGIVHGYDNTTKFGPEDNILRQDLAGILRNYTNYKKKDISVSTTDVLTKFKDYKKTDSYAYTSVQWAVKNGVITGNDDGTLNPKGTATRAEAAAMIVKYCNRFGK